MAEGKRDAPALSPKLQSLAIALQGAASRLYCVARWILHAKPALAKTSAARQVETALKFLTKYVIMAMLFPGSGKINDCGT